MKDALGHGSNAHNSGIEQLPPKGANELRLFADNDANLYRQSKQPVEANLDKKVAKGVYDHELAVKLWGYHADRAAQAYHKQSGASGKWHDAFPPAVRQAAARSWADSYRSDNIRSYPAAKAASTSYSPDASGAHNSPLVSNAARVRAINTRRKGTF